MRFEQDREAHVPVRHGQVILIVVRGFIRRVRVRRLLRVVLRGVQVTTLRCSNRRERVLPGSPSKFVSCIDEVFQPSEIPAVVIEDKAGQVNEIVVGNFARKRTG